MRPTLLLLALVALGLQSPNGDPDYDSDGHLKAEHQIPAGHWCQQTRIYEENVARAKKRGATMPAEAHPCDCTYTCHVDDNGNVAETGGEKSTPCKAYCSKDGRRCTCHTEEPCDLGAGQARFDMHHQMIAMARP